MTRFTKTVHNGTTIEIHFIVCNTEVLSTYINIMAMRVATSAFNGLFVNPQSSIT